MIHRQSKRSHCFIIINNAGSQSSVIPNLGIMGLGKNIPLINSTRYIVIYDEAITYLSIVFR